MRFSNRRETDVKPTWKRHQTDRGTTRSDVEATLEHRIVSGTRVFSMSYSIVNELGSRVPQGLGEGKKNVRELFFDVSLCASGRAGAKESSASAREWSAGAKTRDLIKASAEDTESRRTQRRRYHSRMDANARE